MDYIVVFEDDFIRSTLVAPCGVGLRSPVVPDRYLSSGAHLVNGL
jgi:hypothetical protein